MKINAVKILPLITPKIESRKLKNDITFVLYSIFWSNAASAIGALKYSVDLINKMNPRKIIGER